MVEHGGGDARLLDLPVAPQHRRHPWDVDLVHVEALVGDDDAGVGGVVGDRVDDRPRRSGIGILHLDAGVEDLDRRRHVRRRLEHVLELAVRAAQLDAEHERQLDLDPWCDEAVERHGVAGPVEHVVVDHAAVGLVDADRVLHHLRRQPDLACPHDAPGLLR